MSFPRTALLLSLATVAAVGCTRNQARRDPLRRNAQPSSAIPPLAAAQQPFAPPTPPAPPPLPRPAGPATYVQATLPPVEHAVPTGAPPGFNPPTTLPDASLAQTQGAVPIASTQPSMIETVPTARPTPERIPDRQIARNDGIQTSTIPTATPPSNPVPATSALATASAQPSADDKARQLLDASVKRYAGVTDYEARLVKREVVNGKQVPSDEVAYKFRKQPLSVYMKVLSEAGQGREVIFVKGRDEGAMHVVTGKGDNRLVGAGFKTTIDPDGRDATSKSRYRIYEAGFGRTHNGMDAAIRRGFSVKAVGLKQRSEYPYPLECVEVVATGPGDPSLPPGAKRSIYFDPKPDSPSYLMPVLTEMHDAAGRELEHYCFDQIKLPAGLTDADFDPARLGKRR
jgi:hypothetical protein